jgi:hypothetical protein
MKKNKDIVYTQHVVEFVAVANEYCKYAEHASEINGDELLKILQRLLPLLYLKATFLPELQPIFDDGNEKFITEAIWFTIHDAFKKCFGSANEYLEVFDERANDSDSPVVSSLAENMTDIYQDIKDFLLLYQTGTSEVMNDAIMECKMNFENYWGQKLVNALRAIHKFISSGEKISTVESVNEDSGENKNTSEWFISKRQKEFRDGNE